MTETDFNRDLRRAMRLQGLRVIHIREADSEGTSDLEIFFKDTILAWAELKVDSEPLRPSQVEFLRDRDFDAGNAYLMQLDSGSGIITVKRPVLWNKWSIDEAGFRIVHRTADMTGTNWRKMFMEWQRFGAVAA